MINCPKCAGAVPPDAQTCPACGTDVGLWLSRGGQVYGPYSLSDLQRAQAEGRLSAADMVTVGRGGQWQPLTAVLQAGAAPAAAPVAMPPTAPASVPPATPVATAPVAPRKSSTGTTVVVILAIVLGGFVLLSGIMAAILFPVFAKAREKARQSSCLSNIKQMSLGVLMYAQDYDERLPRRPSGQPAVSGEDYPPDDWHSLIYPYVKNTQIYVCPSIGTPDSYAFNKNLYGVVMGQFTAPYNTMLLSDRGFEEGTDPPHNNGWNLGYVDGHAKWVQTKEGIALTP